MYKSIAAEGFIAFFRAVARRPIFLFIPIPPIVLNYPDSSRINQFFYNNIGKIDHKRRYL
jgi:hypothetical protein